MYTVFIVWVKMSTRKGKVLGMKQIAVFFAEGYEEIEADAGCILIWCL